MDKRRIAGIDKKIWRSCLNTKQTYLYIAKRTGLVYLHRMKILVFSLILVMAALNIFCSALYAKILNRLPGQITGRITLNKLNKVLENAVAEEDRHLIKKCKYAYTVYLTFFYLFLAVVLVLIFGRLKR